MSNLIDGNPLSNLNSLQAPKAVAASIFKRREAKEQTIELTEDIEADGNNAHSTSGYHLNQGSTPTLDIDPHRTRDLSDVQSETVDLLNMDAGVEFPEGGLKAYSVVFGAFMGIIPTFGLINSVGAIESYISANQLANVSTSAISWIFTINTFVTFSSMIFSGALFDKHGSFGPILTGTIFFVSGLIATANAKSVWQFVLTLSIVGVGNGILISPLCGTVSHYFNKKRATALSIATTGGSVGGIVVPLMLRGLYSSVGFVWAIRILAFFSLFCLSWSLLIAKERFRAEPQKIHNWKEFTKTYIIDLFDYNAFKEPRFVFCSLGVALAECGLIIASIYYPSYVIKRGYEENTAYLLITVINATGILGRYIPGYLADKYIGRFNIAILTILCCVLTILTLWLPFGDDLNVLYAFSALYGFFSGSILSLPPVCIGQISRTEEFGKRYSTMYLFVSFTTLAAIPAGGAIIGDGSIKNYNNYIAYVSTLLAFGALFYGVSRHLSVGMKLRKF
jgi:MFS family permease